MHFITVRDLRNRPAEIWKKLGHTKELVITSNGKPIAVMSSVTEENLEESLNVMRKVRAMTAVESIQQQSAKRRLSHISMDKINEEIRATRKERTK